MYFVLVLASSFSKSFSPSFIPPFQYFILFLTHKYWGLELALSQSTFCSFYDVRHMSKHSFTHTLIVQQLLLILLPNTPHYPSLFQFPRFGFLTLRFRESRPLRSFFWRRSWSRVEFLRHRGLLLPRYHAGFADFLQIRSGLRSSSLGLQVDAICSITSQVSTESHLHLHLCVSF